jgi:short-subunit dehydrogenase
VRRPFELPERPSVVVTGASSGIGEASAYRFARAGARLALLARREDRLKAAAERVRSLGGEAHVVPVDLADFERAKSAIAVAEAALGGIDVLVNNAGFGLYAPLESVPRSDLERLFAVNVYGALACAQAVLPGMRRRGRGVIINVSSVVGKRALPMTGAYGATKYALQGLSDALRVELRGTGVRVSVICPGYTISEFSDKVIDYGAERARGRAGAMSSEEVAEAVFRCARRPRRQIVLTGKGRLLVFLERVAPGVADWIVARAIPVKLPELELVAGGDRS